MWIKTLFHGFYFEALLCLSLFSSFVASTVEIKSYKKNWIFKEDQDFIASNPISIGKSNQFAYVPWHANRQEHKNLVLTLENFHADGIIYKDRCATHLPYISMRSSFQNQVIYTYRQDLRQNVKSNGDSYTGYVYYRQVNMINCEYKDKKFFVNTTLVNTAAGQALHSVITKPFILQYQDGSYDIFTFDNSTCDAARCKRFISAEGDLSDKAIPYLPKEFALDSITMYPALMKDSHFTIVRRYPNYDFTKKPKEIKLFYAQPGGEVDELLNFDNKERIIDVDAIDGYLTICWTSTASTNNYVTTVQCNQYNSQKVKVFNKKFELPYDIKTLKIKCLTPAVFILLTEECNDNDCSKGSHYYVKKIQPDGNDSRALEVDGFDPLDVFLPDVDKYPVLIAETNLSLDDKQNICITQAVKRSNSSGVKWSLVWKCFSGKYLSIMK